MHGGTLDDFQDAAEKLIAICKQRGSIFSMTVITHSNTWSWGNVSDPVHAEMIKDGVETLAKSNWEKESESDNE